MIFKISILLVAAISIAYCWEVNEDFANAVPGHLENDPEIRKLFPNIPYSGDTDGRIVGGDEAIPNTRRYQAGMYIPVVGGNAFCGGSLINALTILTAAHCVDSRVGNVTIILGAHYMPPTANDTNVVSVSSDEIIIHPQYNRNILLNDIALVILPNPVPFSANITPVLLPRDDSQDYLNQLTLVSGWGRPSDSVNSISPVLREVSSLVISNYACRMAYLGMIEDSHICISGGHGRGTCNGDSGGPLIINGVQIGVVSFGSAHGCEQGWPPAFTRVTYYLSWIADNQGQV